jgi:hypothetical protein
LACLAAVAYDPAVAVSKATTALLAMTALDTTNLRVTFTAPANGNVFVRVKGQAHGSTAAPRLLLGVLEGAALRGRMTPSGMPVQSLATTQVGQEAAYVITGLTPGNSYSFDAAYGVEVAPVSTAIKYGGPDNTTGNDAFGAFALEVWETASLLAGTLYDPLTAVTQSTTVLLAMTAMDTTNLRLTFTAPNSGKVMWRINAQVHGATTFGQILLGVLNGATVMARSAPVIAVHSSYTATACETQSATGIISGLTPGNSYSLDAAYGVEVVSTAGGIKYGGPNNTTTDDAFGGIAYEIWAA